MVAGNKEGLEIDATAISFETFDYWYLLHVSAVVALFSSLNHIFLCNNVFEGCVSANEMLC